MDGSLGTNAEYVFAYVLNECIILYFFFLKQYIKIPAPTPESPDAFRVFSFYLSSDSKDKPQSSFDCIHQYVSG